MKHIYFTISFFTFLIIALASCSVDTPEETPIIYDVEDEFNIDLREQLSVDDQKLVIELHTIKDDYPCSNYQIDYSIEQDNNGKIIIDILEILDPINCDSSIADAESHIVLNNITRSTHNIEINLKGTVINEGVLHNDDDRFNLEMKTDYGIHLLQRELIKIPQNSIWGYVAYDDDSNDSAAQNFIDDLVGVTEQNRVFENGYYGYFSITGSIIKLKDTPNFTHKHIFIHEYKGAKEDLIDLLETHRNTTNLQIGVFSSTGENW